MKRTILLFFILIGSTSYAQEPNDVEFDIDSITLSNWTNVPHVKGRIATEEDVQAKKAIFYKIFYAITVNNKGYRISEELGFRTEKEAQSL